MNKLLLRDTANAAARTLRDFISNAQRSVMVQNTRGEEGEYFCEKLIEMAALIKTMPKTYEQEGKGDSAIVSLHYFLGGFDWYITEKDMTEGEPQYQAFGYADMGFPEMGYISIQEIICNGGELDLNFTPRTMAEVKAERGE